MKKLTDPEFKYVPAVATDIRKTFARVRQQQRAAAQARAATDKVKPLAVVRKRG